MRGGATEAAGSDGLTFVLGTVNRTAIPDSSAAADFFAGAAPQEHPFLVLSKAHIRIACSIDRGPDAGPVG